MSSSLLRPYPEILPAQVSHVIFNQEQIWARVGELGQQISLDYAGQELIVFGVLKGVLFFMADLIRTIELPIKTDVMAIAGYKPGEKRPSGMVRIIKDLDLDVYNRHVLIIEDMVDTGLTLNFILKMIRSRQPASLAVCALLNREGHRLAPNLPLKYIGFEAPADFLVGYGLDYLEQFRGLPYIAALKPEVYAF
jgi:hypoxanthine phosphoribosyltransferase